MKHTNTRAILKKLGVSELHATLAMQQVFFLPRSSRADANATIIIVKAMQRGLRRAGCPATVDGWLGPKTAKCLEKVSGPKWRNKTWIKLAEEVIAAEKYGIPSSSPAPGSMTLSGVGIATQASGLLLIGAVLVGAFYFTRGK
jgi:hypothetical protein